MSTLLAASWIPEGFQVIDGDTLVGVILDDTYTWGDTHETVADVVGYEVSGAGYSRLSATASAVRGAAAWTLFLDSPTSTDLSAVSNRGGVWWATDGVTDADRRLIGWSPDPGPAVNPYAPTWPDGLADLPIESIDAVLADLQDQIDALGPSVPVAILIPCSDEISPLTDWPAVVTFRMPHGLTLTEVRASLTTASTVGDVVVDINQDGVSVLLTPITIDAGEKTSTSADVPPAIFTTALVDDAEITIDIDDAGTSGDAYGLKVWLIGTRA